MTPALGTHHAQRNSLSQVQTGEQALKSHTLAHHNIHSPALARVSVELGSGSLT